MGGWVGAPSLLAERTGIKRYRVDDKKYVGMEWIDWETMSFEDEVHFTKIFDDGKGDPGWWLVMEISFNPAIYKSYPEMAQYRWCTCLYQARNDPPGPWWGLPITAEQVVHRDDTGKVWAQKRGRRVSTLL